MIITKNWLDSKANDVLHAIKSPSFVVAIVCLQDVFIQIVGLSKFLQTADIDACKAIQHVNTFIAAFEVKRSDKRSEVNNHLLAYFAKVFLAALKLWNEFDMNQNDLIISAAGDGGHLSVRWRRIIFGEQCTSLYWIQP